MTATNAQKLTFSMIALALLFGVLAVFNSSAAAQETTKPVGITGGKTTLKPTKQMIRKLKRAKVTVTPTGSATGGLRKLVFPVTGGRIGMSEGKLVGRIRHQGSGLRFRKRIDGTSPLAFRNPVVNSRDLMIWVGDVGNEVVMRLSETNLLRARDGSIRFRAKLKLTKQSAKLLRKRLGVRFRPGDTVASLISEIGTTSLRS